MQPTAQAPHIGNYLGAFLQNMELMKEYDGYYFIADLHAITVPQDPKALNASIYASFAMLLAVGMSPKTTTIFVQSQNPFHSELGWILNCFTPMGALGRMTQFKEKSERQKEFVSVGLFDYPVLQVADVLLYSAHVVPVGEDQTQHVELMADVAERFNRKYGETFVVPKVRVVREVARIMSLQDPTKKMSKSDENLSATLFLLDTKEQIAKKIGSAVTDSERTIVFDKNRKGLYNLLSIYKGVTGKDELVIENEFKGMGYREFKEALSEAVWGLVKPIQAKYHELINDKPALDRLMKEGAEKSIAVAEKKMKEVKEKIGFIL